MNLRSLIALLVLANYIFLAGMGCISRPEQDSFVVLMEAKSAESQHYESCRYLRTNALEVFMTESLVSNYKKASDNRSPHILSLISGVDAHSLPETTAVLFACAIPEKNIVFRNHESGAIRTVAIAIDAPPERA